MLKLLFYLIIIGYISWEIYTILNFKRMYRWRYLSIRYIKRYIKYKQVQTVTFSKVPYAIKQFYRRIVLIDLPYSIITIIGLFTYCWYVYVLIYIMSTISSILIRYRKHTYQALIDSIICALLLSFAVCNSYYFHLSYSQIYGYIFN